MNVRFTKPLWHLVDARDMIVGRLASQVTHILRGKHKPNFSPNYDCGDYVGKLHALLLNQFNPSKSSLTLNTSNSLGIKKKITGTVGTLDIPVV